MNAFRRRIPYREAIGALASAARLKRLGLLVALALGVLVSSAGSGFGKVPFQHDESTFTWPGAARMAVDVEPWGAGYVRSSPYLIDCPLACVRSWEQGRAVTLTAFPTPGFTFASWEGACAGQDNPCKLTVTGATVEVTATLSGRYVPPEPSTPSGGTGPPISSPSLQAQWHIDACSDARPFPCFYGDFHGSGFTPSSVVTLTGNLANGSQTVVTNSSGAFDATDNGWCSNDGTTPYVGPITWNVTATDAKGLSASVQLNGACPAP
jgi:hypothetical protein